MKYDLKSDVRCKFCDDTKGKHAFRGSYKCCGYYSKIFINLSFLKSLLQRLFHIRFAFQPCRFFGKRFADKRRSLFFGFFFQSEASIASREPWINSDIKCISYRYGIHSHNFHNQPYKKDRQVPDRPLFHQNSVPFL